MFGSAIVRIVGFVILGAILANVLRNPRGTRVVIGGVNDLFRTGLQAASGQRVK